MALALPVSSGWVGRSPPVALEQHGAGHVAGAMDHGLRTLEHGQAIIGIGKHIGGGRVHAATAATQNLLAIEQHVQPRSGHAAQHRVAIGTALADHREAGNGLEDVGTVLGRNRLARLARIGDDRQRLAGSGTGTGHDNAISGIVAGRGGSSFGRLCQQGNRPGQNGQGNRGQDRHREVRKTGTHDRTFQKRAPPRRGKWHATARQATLAAVAVRQTRAAFATRHADCRSGSRFQESAGGARASGSAQGW